MQATKIPVVVEQSKQIDRPVLFTISAQVSFDGLFALIQALPKMQKWQIYQALGVELAPQSAEAKAIARLTEDDDDSPSPKRVQVISFAEHDLSYERAKKRV